MRFFLGAAGRKIDKEMGDDISTAELLADPLRVACSGALELKQQS